MMPKIVSFYSVATGFFDPGQKSGLSPSHIEYNTPPGYVAIEGVYDHLSQRIDIATGIVVDYQPPAPPDTAMASYTWDVPSKRWLATATLAAVQAEALIAIDQAAGEARLRYVTEVPGQQAVYLRKFEQAKFFTTMNYLGDVPPYVAAEATATGGTAQAAAQGILLTATLWDTQISPAIEGSRISGKRAVRAALSTSLAISARDSTLTFLGGL